MGKQVTRLNEAQLHKVIEEATIRILRENKCNEGWIKNMFGATAVTEERLNESSSNENILSELDWKTYANAARKRAIRDKSGQQNNEKVRQLDRAATFALNDKFNLRKHSAQIDTDYDDYHGHAQRGRYPSLGDYTDFPDTFYSDFDNPDRDFVSITSTAGNERSKEMSDYFKGNYVYTKDKGWHLKNK